MIEMFIPIQIIFISLFYNKIRKEMVIKCLKMQEMIYFLKTLSIDLTIITIQRDKKFDLYITLIIKIDYI